MLLAVQGSDDPSLRAYANDILFNQTAKRYATPWHHVHGPFYFLGVIFSMWLPLVFTWWWALPAWRRRIARGDARAFVPLLWSLLLIVFFSISPGKRDVYILPALPMLVYATSSLLPGIFRRRGFQIACGLLGLMLASVCALGGGVGALLDLPAETRFEAARSYLPANDTHWWMLFTVGVVGLIAFARWRLRRGFVTYLATISAIWIIAFGVWGYPLVNDASSARGVMQRVATIVPPGDELALVAWKEQNLLQADRPVREWGFLTDWDTQRREAQTWLLGAPERRWLFILDKALGNCLRRDKLIAAGSSNRREWYLARADAIEPGCVDTTRTSSYDPFDLDDP
jgi:4-amino-4-deoxy-L-arabinose transferase-like glycosyltransferase